MIYTKQEWQKKRDAAGGKGSAVKGVSISDALDRYHKASAAIKKQDVTAKMIAQAPTLTPLLNALTQYKTKMPPNPRVAPLIDEMINSVKKQIQMGAELA